MVRSGMSVGLALVLSLVLFVLLAFILKWMTDFMGAQAARAIEKRHRTAELILATRRIPPAWLSPPFGRLRHRIGLPPERAVRRHALRRMASLISYFDNAAPFESITVKRSFVHALRTIAEEWRAVAPEEFRDRCALPDSSASRTENIERSGPVPPR